MLGWRLGCPALGHGSRVPGIFGGSPRYLQKQTLLGIHPHGLTRRNTEEAPVKAIDVGEQAANSRMRLVTHARVRVVKIEVIPPTPRYSHTSVSHGLW